MGGTSAVSNVHGDDQWEHSKSRTNKLHEQNSSQQDSAPLPQTLIMISTSTGSVGMCKLPVAV
jgi:hypothetical protein